MQRVIAILNFVNLMVCLSIVVTLIWFHGFQYDPHYLLPHGVYLSICILFFLGQLAVRAIASKNWKRYFQLNRFENLFFLFLILEFFLSQFMDFSVLKLILSYTGLENHNHLYILSIHILLLVVVGIELGKASARSTIWKLSPGFLFILSFVVMNTVGSSLLMLPEMTTEGENLSFIDALFTSVSANCVTGLTVVDTATVFTIKGKVLIALLIQFGGLNIIAFATYFISFYRTKFKRQIMSSRIKENYHPSNIQTRKLIKQVIWTTLLIEFIGAIFLYHQWGNQMHFQNNGEQVFYSVFHAISAFNNAGFTLFSDGFANSATVLNYPFQLTIIVLIVLGGLGFMVLYDLFIMSKDAFGRKKIHLHLQSKIALSSSVVLIILGVLVYYFSENGNNLVSSKQSIWMQALFQSVTSRTAGFNTVDFSLLGNGFILFTLVLMFVGASSGSTGGGVKTSTLAVSFLSILKKRECDNNYGNSFLTAELVNKAKKIVLYSLSVIMVSVIILLFTEQDHSFLDLLFEEISAFATVGLSRGITSNLSDIGKTIILLNMFVGKIGPLTLAQLLIYHIQKDQENKKQVILIG